MKTLRQNRREMMLSSLGFAAGLASLGGCAASKCGPPRSTDIGDRGFKIAICDWTLGKMTDATAFDAARRLGVDGLQVDFGTAESNLPILHNQQVQKTYLELSKTHEVRIASFAMCALGAAPLKSDPRSLQWIAEGIDACRAMGVPTLLIPFFGAADLAKDKPGRQTVAERLNGIASKAEQAGVILGIESWLSAEEHMEIIGSAGSPAIKVYYDVANSHKAGHDIYREIRFLGSHICEVHAKDYDGPFGRGSIDFNEVRRALDDIGYRGWIVFESSLWQPTSTLPPELEAGFLYDIAYLRSLFPQNQ
jgi:L-ribulose-5-phosphate 3-epimerase